MKLKNYRNECDWLIGSNCPWSERLPERNQLREYRSGRVNSSTVNYDHHWLGGQGVITGFIVGKMKGMDVALIFINV